jgi:hypothetical protein
MKYLKDFKMFEELDVDNATDNKMRTNSKKIVDIAKKYEQLLSKEGVKMNTRNTQETEESRKLRKEAIDKIKGGDKNAYGIMQWSSSGDICQSITIISPVSGSEVVAAPKYAGEMNINCTVAEDFVTLDVYNSPNESKSLYMESDGEVLFQWSEKPKVSQGKLANKATQLI